MPSSPLPEVEKNICLRLRAFRESKLIPRARMAGALGIGSERLASYETARAPLPYAIFRGIASNFGLNPKWLMTGETVPDCFGFDDAAFVREVPPRATFSAVYHKFLAKQIEQDTEQANARLIHLARELAEINEMPLAERKKISPEALRELKEAAARILLLNELQQSQKEKLEKLVRSYRRKQS